MKLCHHNKGVTGDAYGQTNSQIEKLLDENGPFVVPPEKEPSGCTILEIDERVTKSLLGLLKNASYSAMTSTVYFGL